MLANDHRRRFVIGLGQRVVRMQGKQLFAVERIVSGVG